MGRHSCYECGGKGKAIFGRDRSAEWGGVGKSDNKGGKGQGLVTGRVLRKGREERCGRTRARAKVSTGAHGQGKGQTQVVGASFHELHGHAFSVSLENDWTGALPQGPWAPLGMIMSMFSIAQPAMQTHTKTSCA